MFIYYDNVRNIYFHYTIFSFFTPTALRNDGFLYSICEIELKVMCLQLLHSDRWRDKAYDDANIHIFAVFRCDCAGNI